MSYIIHPLRLGSALRPRDPRSGVHPELIEGPVISYLVIGEGHNILVDTGGSAPDGIRWMPYSRKSEEDPVLQLAQYGLNPEDIDTVIITHLHWDHSGNNALYSNARFFVQKAEYDEFLTRLDDRRNYDPDVTLPTEYELLEGDTEIYKGLSVMLFPGHTAGLQCVIIDTETKPHIILSDAAVRFEHWEVQPRLVQNKGYDSEFVMKCVERIDAIDAIILPGHDMDVFHHSTYPVK